MADRRFGREVALNHLLRLYTSLWLFFVSVLCRCLVICKKFEAIRCCGKADADALRSANSNFYHWGDQPLRLSIRAYLPQILLWAISIWTEPFLCMRLLSSVSVSGQSSFCTVAGNL